MTIILINRPNEHRLNNGYFKCTRCGFFISGLTPNPYEKHRVIDPVAVMKFHLCEKVVM